MKLKASNSIEMLETKLCWYIEVVMVIGNYLREGKSVLQQVATIQ